MRVDVRRVLGRLGVVVAEEKRGELWARCPNVEHESDAEDKWSINARTGRHSCFVCGYGGTIQSLVIYVLGLGGGDEWDGGASAAAEWLAREEGAQPARELPPRFEIQSRVGARRAFALPEGVVIEPVREWQEEPRKYLLEDRAVPAWQAERWGIGYAENGKLRNRLVIVVRDGSGVVRNYMARDFTKCSPRKYLYPSKEEGADYDAVFGEQHWPVRADREVALVAEGALKALALERVAAECVPRPPPFGIAALGGSRVRPMHAVRLSTFGRVVYVRDGGEAGARAWEDVRAQLGRHSVVSCVELPEGHDADSLAKEDPGAISALLAPHVRHT